MVETSGNTAGAAVSEPVTSRLFVALRAFCLELLPRGTVVLQTRQNNTPVPDTSFVLLSILSRHGLTTGAQHNTPVAVTLSMPEEFVVQVSLFGDAAADNARILATAFRSEWACMFFDSLAQQTNMTESQAGTPLSAGGWLQQTPPAVSSGGTLPDLPVPLAVPDAAQRPTRLVPLFAEEIRQLAFINGEQQYEQHWVLTLHCQATSSLTLPQTTASSASITLANTEAFSLREISV